MNCKTCNLAIKTNDAKLGCFGTCESVFHFSCLTVKSKSYKKSLISYFNEIPNLLWFCDVCLPGVQEMFSAATCDHTHHQNDDIDGFALHNTDKSTDDSATVTPMDTDNSTSSDESVVSNPKSKRSRSCSPSPSQTDEPKRVKKSDSVSDDILLNDLIIQSANKPDNNDNISLSTVNSRCIYITPFNPVTVESHINKYLNSKDSIRDHLDKIECKKLVPAKCNQNKLTFVSFKLSVPAECFDEIVNQSFWPTGVTIKEFIVRDKPKRNSTANNDSKQLRFNPYSIRKPVRQTASVNQNTKKSNENFYSHNRSFPNAKKGRHTSSMPSFASEPNRWNNKALPQRKNFRAPFKSQPTRQHRHQNAHQRTSQANQSQNQNHSLLALQLLQNVIPLLSALSPMSTTQTRN